MSTAKLFRATAVFATPSEAVANFNLERVEGVDPIGDEVAAFLETVPEYDPDAVYAVQPGFKTHYVAVARPDDHHPWCFAKPGGVTFQVGDPRNTEAIFDMWGSPQLEVPARLLPTDVWFAPEELLEDGVPIAAVDLCLRLAARWAVHRVVSKA